MFRIPKYKNYRLLCLVVFAALVAIEITPRAVGLVHTMRYFIYPSDSHDTAARYDREIERLRGLNQQLTGSIHAPVYDLHPRDRLSYVVSVLDSIATVCKSRVIAIQPDAGRIENDVYVLPVEVRLGGRYENVYNFIRHIEAAEFVMLIKHADLKPLEPGRPELSARFMIDLYLNI